MTQEFILSPQSSVPSPVLLSPQSSVLSPIQRAFSLVELVIVIVIIGIIAAIAVPRFSKATDNANGNSVKSSIVILQNAIDMYKAECGGYPGALDLLTSTTTINSVTYGPYIRSLPNNPLNNSTGAAASCASTAGWEYTSSSGAIKACSGTAEWP